MTERTRKQDFHYTDPRILTAGLVVMLGILGGQWYESFQDIPETSTPVELVGYGYRINRSSLGHNLLRVEGQNKFPAITPFEGTQRGRERIKRDCGPIITEEDAGSPGEATARVFYVEVTDLNKCFPQE